jgi:hypothetical protein
MANGTVNSHGTPLNKRSGPGTNYPVVGSVPDGTTVTIVCQATGTTETGDWGATDLWDCLDDNTYVSDAFVYTGTNGMVAPACNGSQPPATDQVTAWIEQALHVMNMPADPDTIQDLQIIIMHESSGDPNAVNLTDSNAQAGTPSKGFRQGGRKPVLVDKRQVDTRCIRGNWKLGDTVSPGNCGGFPAQFNYMILASDFPCKHVTFKCHEPIVHCAIAD